MRWCFQLRLLLLHSNGRAVLHVAQTATLDLIFHYDRQWFLLRGFCAYSHVELQPCSTGLSADDPIFRRTVSSGHGCCHEGKWKVHLQGCRWPVFHTQSVGKRLWCELKLTCRDPYGNWVASQTQKGVSSFRVNALPARYHTAEPVLQCLRGKNKNKSNCVQLIAVHHTCSGHLLPWRPQGFTVCAPNQCAFRSCFKICR